MTPKGKVHEVALDDVKIKNFSEFEDFPAIITGRSEQFYYWRKFYELQDVIVGQLEMEGKSFENCGFYRLSKTCLEVIKQEDHGFAEKLDDLSDTDNLYYHPWW